MTKKMEKIVDTMKEKMNDVAWMYEQKYIDFTELQNRTMELVNQFEDMKSGMYHYNLISEKDFDETTHTAWKYRNSIINKIIGL